jgi:transcription elongation factor Elf1
MTSGFTVLHQNIAVTGCRRCGKDHAQLLCKPLTNPADEYTHFVICPETKEPLMVSFKAAEEAAPPPAA